jgi:hypothetical protein
MSTQGVHLLYAQQQILWLATTSASTFENKIFHNQTLDQQFIKLLITSADIK